MGRVFTLATAANRDPAGMLGGHKTLSQRRPSAKKMSHFTFGDAIKGSFKNIFLLMMAKGGEWERKGKACSRSPLVCTCTRTCTHMGTQMRAHTWSLLCPPHWVVLKQGKMAGKEGNSRECGLETMLPFLCLWLVVNMLATCPV